MRVYIVTKNDYRYVNGRFFPVDTFDTNIMNALYHNNILVGVYDSFSAAEADIDEDIRVNFTINEVIRNYKSSIFIEKSYYSNQKQIDVLVLESDGFKHIQMIYYIAIKDFENPADDDKKGIQLKDLKSEDIDSIVEEAAENDEDDEYVADECYIDDDTIDFVGPGNRRTSAQVSKDYDDEFYIQDLLYELAEATDIYTHFYDLRERKPGKNLVLELTGVQPIKDNYDPDNIIRVEAYCTDAVKDRECVYKTKYQIHADYIMSSDSRYNVIFNFLNFADDNLDLSEYDNLYIVDKRVHPAEKDNPKEDEDHKKAIECTISTSNYNNDNTLLVFKFKIDGTRRTKSLSKVATNIKDFIRYLKKYTDSLTKFIDDRVGSAWNEFFDRVSYDCHIIEMDAKNITLKHHHSNGTIGIIYKNERKFFEYALDQIKDANIIYISDVTANSVHPTQKDYPKEDEDHEKAIKCTIYDYPHPDGGAGVNVIYKFKNGKKEKKIYTSNDIFINDLKKYTDKNTIFYDMRVETVEYFYDSSFTNCYIININGNKDIHLITCPSPSESEKIIKRCNSLEEALNNINKNRIFYIRSTYKM